MMTQRLLLLLAIGVYLLLSTLACGPPPDDLKGLARPPLKDRVPSADARRSAQVRNAGDWKNPFLIVRPDGVEVYGITPVGQPVPPVEVPEILEKLPDTAWPHGLVVAVKDIGIIGSRDDLPRIRKNREELLRVLNELGF